MWQLRLVTAESGSMRPQSFDGLRRISQQKHLRRRLVRVTGKPPGPIASLIRLNHIDGRDAAQGISVNSTSNQSYTRAIRKGKDAILPRPNASKATVKV